MKKIALLSLLLTTPSFAADSCKEKGMAMLAKAYPEAITIYEQLTKSK